MSYPYQSQPLPDPNQQVPPQGMPPQQMPYQGGMNQQVPPQGMPPQQMSYQGGMNQQVPSWEQGGAASLQGSQESSGGELKNKFISAGGTCLILACLLGFLNVLNSWDLISEGYGFWASYFEVQNAYHAVQAYGSVILFPLGIILGAIGLAMPKR